MKAIKKSFGLNCLVRINEDIVELRLVIGIFSIGMFVLSGIARTRCIWSRTYASNASGSGSASSATATASTFASTSGDRDTARENRQSNAKYSDYEPELNNVFIDFD